MTVSRGKAPAASGAHSEMPPLDPDEPPLSRFEFWPARLFYLPVALWALWLAIRYRGLRLPMLANPLLGAGGIVGESKGDALDLVGGASRKWIAPYVRHRNVPDATLPPLAFPIVAKPDIGCRGAGVQPIADSAELDRYIAAFPQGEMLILQQRVAAEGEAGVFYVREPGALHGRIISLTLKYFPFVIGDGASTLEQLIRADRRAGRIAHIYLPRHTPNLDRVIPAGERYPLVFAGNHSKGAIFRDGTQLVTEAMRQRFDAISADIPEFHFGRFDVRFDDIEELRRGEGFRIIEYNGGGAEATHIWDSRISLLTAYRVLFAQWAILWRIGHLNRRRGFRAPSLISLYRNWRRESELVRRYPLTA